jgi:hypothetical protein
MLNVPLLPKSRVAALALTGAGPNGQYGREEEWAERLHPGIFFAVPTRSSAARRLDGTMAANHYNHWLARRRESKQGRRTKVR